MQRVLNDLQRPRLFRGRRVIWLLAHPLPPSPVSKLDWRHTRRQRKRDKLLIGEGGKGVSEEPNHKTSRKQKSLLLYISFDTLCFDSNLDFVGHLWLARYCTEYKNLNTVKAYVYIMSEQYCNHGVDRVLNSFSSRRNWQSAKLFLQSSELTEC